MSSSNVSSVLSSTPLDTYFTSIIFIINSILSFFQLYEISDDPKRKEFLDDLFSFMQKRGKFLLKI